MPVLECSGVFSLPFVPDGWRVTGTAGRFYELTPPTNEGALHISVYERDDSALSAEEAERLVAAFVERLPPLEPAEVHVLPESEDQHRAVCRCTATDPDSGDTFDWLIFLVLWKSTFLMCTCTAPFGSVLIGEAEKMFASIYPEKPKRRLFGRR